MKILELNFEKSWRGGERQTLYNMLGFRDALAEVHLLCRKDSAMEVMAKREGFIVHSFQSIIGVIFFLLGNGRRYHFLHAQTSQILTYCVFTKFIHRAKVIFTRRVNFAQKGSLTKIKYHLTDKIIAISPSVKKTLEAFTGRTDIEVISDIVVKKQPDQKRAVEFISKFKIDDKRLVATIAALTKEKDPFTLVDAIKKLSAIRNDFAFLHFGSGELEEPVRKKIEEKNLGQVYYLMGFQDNVEDFFSLFEVFVLTSKEEGLGSSALDAFVHRVPVVSTNAGGLGDLLSNDRGILCEIGDSDALAKGIDLLLTDSAKKTSFVKNAADYVNFYHDQKYLTEKYLQVMKQL